ncbi:D-serine deaminase, pyridoxal phosphate-dependent [Friedmanniella luteola]|uniref:D-serine deaminase, pyridoxal phosphate-dependent n=1 Tax=Friedmanniella luteola TaxID=546871 RepID=A0A1H1L4Q0_9ACTN|nr:alanine racemase [Friedmanniella luteola]SDR69516.1 D-serine deaminase, pyridoxal phosphate-dependent [Friedmanniella luteola]
MGARPDPDAGRPDPHALLRTFVGALAGEPLDWRQQGFGGLEGRLAGRDLAAAGLRLSDLGSPLMTLDAGALRDNLSAMAAWCAERGVGLAPHGKTTMAPALWLAQLDAGATAITVANAAQLRAAHAFGVRALVVANQLVAPGELRWLAAARDADPALEVLHWVDSVAAVDQLDAALAGALPRRPLTVCVELGSPGGRTGARSDAEVVAVAERVLASPACVLAGVSGYEGAVPGAGGTAEGLAAVGAFLQRLAAAYRLLADRFQTPVVTLTAGGSAHFDAVADVLGPLDGEGRDRGHRVVVVVRSGAYVVHDDVHYARLTPSTRGGGPVLRPAIHVWAQVLSRPEPGLVVLDAGKRDLPFDLDLPVVLAAVRRGGPGTTPEPVEPGATTVTRLNDQHAYVEVEPASALAVGDVVRLGLSHPCTAFDKWRTIAVVASAQDVDPVVVDAVHTFF